jgi:hypothetical protein
MTTPTPRKGFHSPDAQRLAIRGRWVRSVTWGRLLLDFVACRERHDVTMVTTDVALARAVATRDSQDRS